MARSDDETPGAKPSPGAKKKRALTPKPAPRARKASEAAQPLTKPAKPAARRAPAGVAKTPKAGKAPVKPKEAAPRTRKAAPRAAAPKAPKATQPAPAPKPAAARKPAAPRRARPARVPPAEAAPAVPSPALADASVSEEERIEEAKYSPRERPPRAFEEERFLFPETYGENRVRLLVKDPEWLFAHWDVAPASLDGLRSDVGERTAALSRLTLRIRDPHHGGLSVILLPEGVRSWYVKADQSPRAYRAELGFTLPSGEFRGLAESNTVRTPWAGSSGERAGRRARFDGAAPTRAAGAVPAAAADPGHEAPGPWTPEPRTQIGGQPETEPSAPSAAGSGPGPGPAPGGASDVYRR